MRTRWVTSVLLVAALGCSGGGDDDDAPDCEESSVAIHNNSGANISVRIDNGSSRSVSNNGSTLFEGLSLGGHTAHASVINVPNGYCSGDWESGDTSLDFDLGCSRETFYCE